MLNLVWPMRAVLFGLAGLYVIGAAPLFHLAYRVFVRSCTEGQLTFHGWVITFAIAGIPAGLALVYSALAYLLITLRHRRVAIALAAMSCVEIPYGTILGMATIVVLLWPAIASSFDAHLNERI